MPSLNNPFAFDQKNKKPPPRFYQDGSMNGNLKNQLLLLVFFVLVWFFAGWSRFDVTRAVLLLESLYSTGCIDIFLLASIERMAHRAYFSMDFFCRAASLECTATTATNHYFLVLWMYFLFHNYKAPKYLN